jgi:hypothetical protein
MLNVRLTALCSILSNRCRASTIDIPISAHETRSHTSRRKYTPALSGADASGVLEPFHIALTRSRAPHLEDVDLLCLLKPMDSKAGLLATRIVQPQESSKVAKTFGSKATNLSCSLSILPSLEWPSGIYCASHPTILCCPPWNFFSVPKTSEALLSPLH